MRLTHRSAAKNPFTKFEISRANHCDLLSLNFDFGRETLQKNTDPDMGGLKCSRFLKSLGLPENKRENNKTQ